jgi:hypothetical protein
MTKKAIKSVVSFVTAAYVFVKEYLVGKEYDAPLCDIFWPEERNSRHQLDYGNEATGMQLVRSLRTGWNKLLSPTIQVAIPPKEKIAEYNKRRHAQWEALKKTAHASTGNRIDTYRLEAFEFYNVNPETGELYPVRLVGNMSFRRARKFLDAYISAKYPHEFHAKKVGDKTEAVDLGLEPIDPPTFHINVVVADYLPDGDDKLIDFQATENTNPGRQELGEASLLSIARRMKLAGKTQQDFRVRMKDGMGQKMWEIMSLDQDPRYRGLKFWQRCVNGVDAKAKLREDNQGKKQGEKKEFEVFRGGPIDSSKLNTGTLRTFRAYHKGPERFRPYGKDGLDLQNVVLEASHLEDYFIAAMSGKSGNAHTMMDRGTVKNLVDAGSNSKIVLKTLRSVYDGDGTAIGILGESPEFVVLLDLLHDLYMHKPPKDTWTKLYKHVAGIYEKHVGISPDTDATVNEETHSEAVDEEATEELQEKLVAASGRKRKK